MQNEQARVPSHPYSRTGREKANSAALQIAYSPRSSQIQLTFNLQQHSLIVRRQVVLLYIDTGECTKGVGLDARGSRDSCVSEHLGRSWDYILNNDPKVFETPADAAIYL